MVDKLTDEPGRLAALTNLKVANTQAEQPFDHIAELAKSTLKYPIAAVTFITRNSQLCKARKGFDIAKIQRDYAFCTKAIMQRDVLVIEDARLDDHFSQCPIVTGPPHVIAYAGAPLVLPDGYQVGTLCVMDVHPRTLTAAEEHILSQLAGCVVRELELHREATQDDLTGLMRRSSFFSAARRTIAACLDGNQPAALALLDLDRFKQINDTHGHAAGDAVLVDVARIAFDELGEHAAVARVGGEEFALCMPGFGQDAAFAALERLRCAIASRHFAELNGETVTASTGIAMLDHHNPALEQWYKAADAALYAAKNSGRNRVLLATDGIAEHDAPHTLPFLDLADQTEPAAALRCDAA